METATEKTVNMIKDYFDSVKWGYELVEEDNWILFDSGYEGVNEKISVTIYILKKDTPNYQILCCPQTKIPLEHIQRGLSVVNNYNGHIFFHAVWLSEKTGSICFWKTHECLDAISEADFKADFKAIIMRTDDDTAQIFKEVLLMEDDVSSKA